LGKAGGLAVAVVAGVAVVVLETALCWWLLGRRPTDVVMVYLLGVVVVALRYSYAPSLVTAAASVAAFDFFFVPPYFSFAIEDKGYLLTFLIMLLVGLLVSNLADRVRRHAAQTSALALDRARLAEEAQRVHAEVEGTRLRNALLSSVSHDLRTPLAVMQGAATALLDDRNPPPAERHREYLRTIADEAGHLNRLVGNLLSMTALQAGDLRVKKTWHPLEELVGVVLNRLEETLGSHPMEVHIAEEAALVLADEMLLRQVLVNLVENAARYTPADARIRIGARRVPAGLEIEVADSGPGVPPGEEEAIFEKFHRAATKAGGMGLGLTICRGIVSAHGGRIWCENRTEGGASFRFILPLDQEAPTLVALPDAPEERAT
jgi:two-component system sensor histidine kinase KdpD